MNLESEITQNVENADNGLNELSIRDYFQQKYADLSKQSPDIFENVRCYKSDYYYFNVNAIARMGLGGYKDSLKKNGQLDKTMEKRIEEANDVVVALEIIFQNSALNKATSVYRRVSDSTIQQIKESAGVFTDNGFVSTSHSLEDVKKFHNNVHTIKIELPTGTRVIDMPSALKYTSWKDSANWENELVIDKGYSYEVLQSDSNEYEFILKLMLK